MKQFLILHIIFLLLSTLLQAEIGYQLKQMQDEQRVALLIGNNNYLNIPKLEDSINNIRELKNVLQNRGFDVIYKENASKDEMKKLLNIFSQKLEGGGVGLYYFSGHDASIDSNNFLVGVDSLMDNIDEVEYETLELKNIINKMQNAKNRLNIIILDACRKNPFSNTKNGGIFPITNASGILTAYSTEAGKSASDGTLSIFTKNLIKNIKNKHSDLDKVFKNTRADVYDATNGKQIPVIYNQTIGDLYFTLPNNIYKNKPAIKKIVEIQKPIIKPYKGVVSLYTLMWQDNNDSKTIKMNWQNAKKYCTNLTLDGYDDWYLPNKKELFSIVNKSRKPSIEVKFKNVSSSIYWTSSPKISYSTYAYGIYFKTGRSYRSTKSDNFYVRCVRVINDDE